MNHHRRHENGVTVLELEGPLDVSQAYEFRDLLGALVDGPAARLLIDLDRVTLIDSSGVGVLVTGHRRAAEAEARMVLARPGGSVGRVFEMTRTDRLLRIFPSVEEGLAALRDE